MQIPLTDDELIIIEKALQTAQGIASGRTARAKIQQEIQRRKQPVFITGARYLNADTGEQIYAEGPFMREKGPFKIGETLRFNRTANGKTIEGQIGKINPDEDGHVQIYLTGLTEKPAS